MAQVERTATQRNALRPAPWRKWWGGCVRACVRACERACVGRGGAMVGSDVGGTCSSACVDLCGGSAVHCWLFLWSVVWLSGVWPGIRCCGVRVLPCRHGPRVLPARASDAVCCGVVCLLCVLVRGVVGKHGRCGEVANGCGNFVPHDVARVRRR